MSSTYSGALIGESLRPAAVVEGFPLTVTKIYRAKLTGQAESAKLRPGRPAHPRP
jgi:hypothetical protein